MCPLTIHWNQRIEKIFKNVFAENCARGAKSAPQLGRIKLREGKATSDLLGKFSSSSFH